MDFCTSTNTKKIIGALMVGTAIGVALGILYAPAKGADTRKNITGKGEDLADAVKEKFNDLVDTFKKEASEAKGKMS
ncbi:gas vesicle protein [Flavipsychrobacter stenotrophus]|uniref:Gas vesicle protein n=1 Tax=Flavipsychrobacter stenotrophus TaxID=2077091 RepID=A0A2S7SXY3_9BACT|nr:YtxH domain-containing protein [Flavipsychrobacter stenotrophus]PQJ11396.1 gas vesicle protein [Flavipsychrobacter stenotrophus]